VTAPTLASFTGARDRDGSVRLIQDGGHVAHHDVGRWLRDADAADRRALAVCDGPTLDIGCGPGRLTVSLAERGVCALGVDICADAVALTQERGAAAIRRDVFSRLPGEGHWRWAVLADGNVGIGGNPERLLRRVGQLLGPDGGAVVEVCPHEIDHRGAARLQQADGSLGAAFPWAVLGGEALRAAALRSGWQTGHSWLDGDRRFVVLHRPAAPSAA